jgi:hypothetical protein
MSDLRLQSEVLAQLNEKTWHTPRRIGTAIYLARVRKGQRNFLLRMLGIFFPRLAAWIGTPSTMRIEMVLERLNREGAATASHRTVMQNGVAIKSIKWRRFLSPRPPLVRRTAH